MRFLRDDRGSAPVEFVMVGTLLTVMVVAVIQIGVAMYVRNVLTDAAVEGAHVAALADGDLVDGTARTVAIISRAVGEQYAGDVQAARTERLGVPTVEITVRAPLAVFGFIGLPDTVEVTGYAPVESLVLD